MAHDKRMVVMISGKNSVVSFLKFLDEANKAGDKYEFIFSIAYIPSEYDEDPTDNIFSLGEILKLHAERYGHKVIDMAYMAETNVWFKIIKQVFGKNEAGICTPCLLCRAYTYLSRIDLACEKDADILSYETSNGGGIEKITEHPKFIEFINKYFEEYNITIHRPLMSVSDEDIDAEWKKLGELYDFDIDSFKMPKCALENNLNMSELSNNEIDSYVESMIGVLKDTMDTIVEDYRKESAEAFTREIECNC